MSEAKRPVPPSPLARVRGWLYQPALPVMAFATIVAITIFQHEMWHDELNSWDVARDAHSLPGLFANMHFEAHPALWYLCLYAITRLTTNPLAMQLLHLAMAVGTAALIAWFAPFTVLERWLLLFGYFFVFEFAVISRGYALGLLLAVAVCVVYVARDRPRVLLLAILLALLANTSLYGVFLTVALTAGIAIDRRLPRDRTTAVGALLVIGASIVSLLTLYPARDNAFAPEWHKFNPTRVEGVLGLLTAAYVPFPDFHVSSPWNSSVVLEEAAKIHDLPRGLPAALAAGILIASAVIALRRDPAAFAAYLLGSAMMLLFIYLKYSGGMRHHGHLFILLVLCIWIARRGVRPATEAPLLVVLLAGQVLAGAYFIVRDLREPFSFSKDLTNYVRDLPKPTPVVIAQPDFLNYAGPVISGYLRRPVTYVLAHRIMKGSFMLPDAEHRHRADEADIARQLQTFMDERGSDVYVVTNNWEPATFGPPLAHFDRHLENDERFANVYLVRRER